MKERIEQAKRRAIDARETALRSGDPRAKDEWLRIARMWEDVAQAYAEIQNLRDGTAGRAG